MPTPPSVHFPEGLRKAFLVRWDEDPDSDDGMTFVEIPMRYLKAGDYFTLEARHETDPLYGLVATERLFKAVSDPFVAEGVPCIECERV